MTPTLTELESRLDAIANNIIVARVRLGQAGEAPCRDGSPAEYLERANMHLKVAARALTDTILDIDGLRLDLLKEQHDEIQPYTDWDRDYPGWAERIHDAIEEGD
jgi:hypothetical protein